MSLLDLNQDSNRPPSEQDQLSENSEMPTQILRYYRQINRNGEYFPNSIAVENTYSKVILAIWMEHLRDKSNRCGLFGYSSVNSL